MVRAVKPVRWNASGTEQGYPGPAAAVKRWVEKRLGGYVRMSIADRRAAVKELAGDGMSQRGIGEVLGVDHRTVGGDLNGENSPSVSDAQRDADATSGENSPLSAVAVLAADEKVRTGA